MNTMQANGSKLAELAARVINPPAPGEKEIESAIRELVRGMGFEARSESVPGGAADIFLPSNNLVIETKDRGKVNPTGSGSLLGETQRQQLERYVFALHAQRRQELPMTPNNQWRGILTDGMLWYLYEWHENDEGNLSVVRSDEDRPPTFETDMLLIWFQPFISQIQLKRRLPDDLYGIFALSLYELQDIYQELADTQGVITKFALWRDMLEGSGFEVGGSAEALFINHTFLVTVAEAVIATLNTDEREPTEIMSDGFASWPQNRGVHGPLHNRGTQWVERIFEIADGYDWRSRERDVLRVLYQNIIDTRHRKAFGEYYTPDWLAQLVVDEVLDDDWIDNAIRVSLIDRPAAPPSSTAQQHRPAASVYWTRPADPERFFITRRGKSCSRRNLRRNIFPMPKLVPSSLAW